MNILVLEDDSDVATFFRLVLQTREYTVSETLEAYNGLSGPYDLLIADVNLPVSSGIEVALKLLASTSNLKIILTSGFPIECFGHRHRVLFNQLPSDSVRFLMKPFSMDEVLHTIDSFVASEVGSPRVAAAAG